MKYIFSIVLLISSLTTYCQKVEGSGPSVETAFVDALRQFVKPSIEVIETTKGSIIQKETQERIDTSIGNVKLQLLSNHISKNRSAHAGSYDNVYEEVCKLEYVDSKGNLFTMDFSIRFDEDLKSFARIEKMHIQTYNLTFESILEYLKTQGFILSHRTEKTDFKSIIEDRIHFITLEYNG